MSAGEEYYDKIVAPKLLEVGRLCEEAGFPIVATVEYAPDERGSTIAVCKESSVAMVALSLLAKSGNNIDQFILRMIRHCKENNIDTSASFFMTVHGREI
jgi:hypothetical protein